MSTRCQFGGNLGATWRICGVVSAVQASTFAPRFEQLSNGLVHELFFPPNYVADIRLFAAREQENIARLVTPGAPSLPGRSHG